MEAWRQAGRHTSTGLLFFTEQKENGKGAHKLEYIREAKIQIDFTVPKKKKKKSHTEWKTPSARTKESLLGEDSDYVVTRLSLRWEAQSRGPLKR